MRRLMAALAATGFLFTSLASGAAPVRADVESTRTFIPGSAGLGAKADPTTGLIYAVSQYVSDGTAVHSWLYVIENGVLIDQVQLPYAAGVWDIDPTTQRAYIVTSSYPAYTLRVVDLTSRTIVNSISLPSQALNIDADPTSGRVAITLISPHRVWVLDGPTLGLVGNVSLGLQPQWVAVEPGGAKVYVTTGGATSLELSGAGYTTQRTLPGSNGWALALDADADILYVASVSSGLLKIDIASGAIVDSDPTPPWGQYTGWLALDDDGARLLGPNQYGQISILDPNTLDEVGVIGGFNGIGRVSVDAPDLLVVSEGTSTGGTGEVIQLVPTTPPAVLPVASTVATTVTEGDPVEDEFGWNPPDETVDVEVEVQLDQPSTEWARLTVAYTGDTAVLWDDFYSETTDVYVAPGQTVAQARLVVRADDVEEGTETLSFAVVDALGATPDPTPADITILDDDVALPVASIVPVDPFGAEVDGALEFSIELDIEPDAEVTIDWATTPGTATADDDYDSAGGQAVFEAGQTVATVSIPLVDDLLVEGDETFSIELIDSIGAAVDGVTAEATILDDDEDPIPAPVASIQPLDPSGVEAEGIVEFYVELDTPSADEVTVDWSTTSGSADADVDFDGAGGQAVFAPGETLAVQAVTVYDDSDAEPDETFSITLDAASGATVDPTVVVATIFDDDTPPSVVTAGANIALAEGADDSTRSAMVSVVFTPPTSGEVEVLLAANPITATDGVDYTLDSDTVVVPAGTSSVNVPVTIIGDNLDEANETLDLEVLDVTGNAVLGVDVTSRVTINDDDATPRIAVNDVAITEGGVLPFNVTLSAPSGRQVTVRYATSRGTGTEAADFTAATGTITFAPGETSATIGVTTTADNIDEVAELVNFTLSSPTNATIFDTRGIGTINDDDTSVVSMTGPSVLEGNTGRRSANFVVTLSGPSETAIVVGLSTSDITAISTGTLRDYLSYSSTVTFSAGQTSRVVAVQVQGDRRVEPDETFRLTIGSVTNGAGGVGNSAVGTIRNDD